MRARWRWRGGRSVPAPPEPEPPRGVWMRLVDGSRRELEPVFNRYEDDVAIWRVTVLIPGDDGRSHDVPPFEALGADLIPPKTTIEWKLPGLLPWRHPDGKG